MAALASTFLLPAAPARAQSPAYFDFVGVTVPTCVPGEYPEFHFFYGVNEGVVVYHIWTLTNTTKGTSTGPKPIGPISSIEEEIIGHQGNINPIPAGTEPGDTLVQTVSVVDAESDVQYDIDQISWSCSGETVPGCDTALPITSTSVVGAFTQTTPADWAPGKLTNPLVTIEAGKTAWVLGLDSTKAFYKIIWVCDLLWVPVNTLGPNYDAIWNGKPLPTGIVN
jgi:hypothetical protein